MTFELLAITPPGIEAIDPCAIDRWERQGALERRLAVVARAVGRPLRERLGGAPWGELLNACRARSIAIVLNCSVDELDELDVRALERAGFVGVHLRGDPSVAELQRVRRRIGELVLGRSCHGAPTGGHPLVDYSCLAPVFAPRTDGHGKIPAGLDAVRGWARNPAAHVIALGGVSKDTAHDCIAAGARGLASIRGFFGAPEAVEQDVAAFVAALRHVSPRPTRR